MEGTIWVLGLKKLKKLKRFKRFKRFKRLISGDFLISFTAENQSQKSFRRGNLLRVTSALLFLSGKFNFKKLKMLIPLDFLIPYLLFFIPYFLSDYDLDIQTFQRTHY